MIAQTQLIAGLFSLLLLCSLGSCQECQTCIKTIGGVAGTFVDEERKVCDEEDARILEASSTGTTVWTCEL
jgi:hypothetical protein